MASVLRISNPINSLKYTVSVKVLSNIFPILKYSIPGPLSAQTKFSRQKGLPQSTFFLSKTRHSPVCISTNCTIDNFVSMAFYFSWQCMCSEEQLWIKVHTNMSFPSLRWLSCDTFKTELNRWKSSKPAILTPQLATWASKKQWTGLQSASSGLGL